MENETIKLEKKIEELKAELRFKRLCLNIAIQNRLYTLQTALQDGINSLRVKINELRLRLSKLTKDMRVIDLDEFKKEINENFKCRH